MEIVFYIILFFIVFYIIIAGPIHLFINWLFGNLEKSCSSSTLNEDLTLKYKTKPKATVLDMNSDEIEVNTSYDELSNLLTLELYYKSSKKLIDTYFLQLDSMAGNQTKVTKEIDNGLIQIIQTKQGESFDLEIIMK